MELIEKYANLLSFFDPKKFNLDELAKIIDMVITKVKAKGGVHQAGCAWAIMILYKRGKCTTLQIEDVIEEFNEHCKGFDNYINSIVMGDKDDAVLIYYHGFIYKKIK